MASIHVFLVPALLGSVLYFVSYTLKERFISDARSTADLIVSALQIVDPATNKDAAANLLDEIVLISEIVFVEIELPDSTIINSVFAENSAYFKEDFSFNQNKDEIYYIALPVYLNGKGGSFLLRIGFDEKPLTEELSVIFSYLAIVISIYIVINLLLVFYLGRRTTQPLKKLLHASRLIRKGYAETNLDVKSPVTDVRDLAKNLNLMREEMVSQTSALQHQAMHDMLTELPNRLLLEDRMRQAILAGSRMSKPFTLLLMDLDRFKEVNDTLGHQAGDEILRQAATRLLAVVRKVDTVARLGGDEFAVLLHDARPIAARIAENMVLEMERTFTVKGHAISIGASVGIAHYPDQCDNAEELMRQADIAMYEAKNSGIHFKVYNASYDKQALDKLLLNNDLREAIKNEDIILHYQPKFNFQTDGFSEVEALARWQHPEKGLLFPDKFIALAENNGLIAELTNNLLEMAINDAANWYHSRQPLYVSLNLSPQNLLDDSLPRRVKELLQFANLPAEYISFEITENSIIQDPERARNILLQLKDMGVYSIIDDFGTGYSSLVSLRDLPVNEIKIDKSFVIDMLENEDDLHIVKAIINMAHDLDLSVTAEGVENAKLSQKLKEMNCDKGQGYNYSKALSVDDLNEWRYNSDRQKSSGDK